ncbi:hypothetical protein A8E69_35010 [Burkholderia cenocepacia]|nr:hypothetical protein A8E69_35010 [Burkholderia cenocepacia]
MTRLTDRHKTIPYFKRVLVSSDTWGRSTSVKQVATRLGVSTWSLHRWVRERHASHPAVDTSPEHSSEIQWLRAELLRVTEERDMLEKAAAYFAKQAG